MVNNMPESIIFEKTVALKDGTPADIRERDRNEESIILAVLQYFVKHLADSGDVDYSSLLDSGERVGKALRGKYLVVIEARVGGEVAGHATLVRRWPIGEVHVADLRAVVEEAYQGNGLGTALTEALLEYGPAKLPGVTKVVTTIPAGDESATTIARRTGFQVHGYLPGTTQPYNGSADQLVFVRDVMVSPELAEFSASEVDQDHLFPPQWQDTDQVRKDRATLLGFLGGFDIERFDEVDPAGIWDWASRFVLELADRDPDILQGLTREEYLKQEGLRVIPLTYLKKMAKDLGYAVEK